MPTEDETIDHTVLAGDPHSLARALSRASPDARAEAFTRLPPDRARRIFRLLEPADQVEILNTVAPPLRRTFLQEMEPDDRARMLSRLPDASVERVLADLDAEERRLTTTLLRYPEDSAGRIMNPEFLPLRPGMSMDETLAAIREDAGRAETVYILPVVEDNTMRLLGTVELAAIVVAPSHATIGSLVSTDVPAVPATEDRERVARLMKAADLMVVPVVDEGNRLVGIITFDDAMEVLEAEEAEDFARAGAAEPLARPYLSVPVLQLVRSRIVWLSLLAVAATLTVNVLDAFEDTLDRVVSLALFIPLLIGIGGNAGAQSATTVVRALAVNDIRLRDALRVLTREASTGFVLGLAIALVAYALVTVVFDPDIGLIVATTLVAICTLAAAVGSSMPMLARSVSIDPAVISAPFVTTIVDATGLLVYFLIATAVLGL